MEQTKFIATVGTLARADMQKTGILASLTIAQAILESGWGTSELCQNASALFGIKADNRWGGKAYSKETQECYDGVSYTTVTALFRAYDSWAESVSDHSAFLLASSRYAAVVGERDYKTACKAIKAAGYATAPDYAEKLISIIERYGLTAYDEADTEQEECNMSNSALVNYTRISPNRTSPRKDTIKKITIHHMAGNLSVETCGSVFAPTSRQASANYGIGTDGRVGMYVEEKDCAWTSSNADNDNQAVTIEVANDEIGGQWHVSDTALAKLIDLCVDICQRNGIAKLNYTGDKTGNLTMHKWFAATACPGPYLESKFPYIAEEVNKRLNAGTTTGSAAASGGVTATTAYKVGDVVQFTGTKHYTSAAGTSGSTAKPGPAKITAISQNAKHPYHVIHTDSTSTVYGWVDAADISAEASGTVTHTVVSGDTVSALAAKYGTTTAKIVAANKSTYPTMTANYIVVGWKLTIPQ